MHVYIKLSFSSIYIGAQNASDLIVKINIFFDTILFRVVLSRMF